MISAPLQHLTATGRNHRMPFKQIRRWWLSFVLMWLFPCQCAFASDPLRPKAPELVALEAALKQNTVPITALTEQELSSAQGVEKQLLLAKYAAQRSKYEQALSLLNAAELAAKLQSSAPLQLAVLEQKAALALEQVQFAQTQAALDAMLALTNSPELEIWKARALALQGGYWRRKGDYAKSLEQHRQALALRKKLGDQFGMIESLNAVATLQRRAGDFYQALGGHNKALALARELEMQREVSESLRLIARIHSELNDFKLTRSFSLQALAAESEPGYERANLLIELAGVELRRGDIAEAIKLTDEGTQMIERYAPSLTPVSLARRSSIAFAQNQFAEALDWIDKAIVSGARFDGARSILAKRTSRLKILLKLARFAEAVPEAAQLLNMTQLMGDVLLERDILSLQAQALFGAGDSKAAYLAISRFGELNQQVSSAMTTRRIADLQASLKQRGLEAELTLAEKQRDVSLLQAERQRLLVFVLAVTGIALMFAVLAFRARIHHIRAVNKMLQAQTDQLKIASETDTLTGLLNRRGAMRALENVQQSNPSQLGVALIDIDYFKRINDQHGHHGGDQVLREVAHRLALCTPKSWALAR